MMIVHSPLKWIGGKAASAAPRGIARAEFADAAQAARGHAREMTQPGEAEQKPRDEQSENRNATQDECRQGT